MNLMEQVSKDIADAMRAKDQPRLSALRMLKSALMNKEVEKGRSLDAGEMQQVVTSLVKQRRDSIEQFERGGRQDLVDKETAELQLLETYLPPAVTAADLGAAIDATIAELGAAGTKDIGKVMKAVMAGFAGQNVDGKSVNELVRRKLSG
jgi:uncharacterized protein YqeY